MQHTKGPWKKTGNTIYTDQGVIAVTARRNDHGFNWAVSAGSERDAANARLIALAPEMLDALKTIAKVIDEKGSIQACDMNDALICQLIERVEGK